MMKRTKLLLLAAAVLTGGLFSYLQLPAGWLLGGLVTGIACGMSYKRLVFDGWPFRTVLALIGCNIGFMMEPGIFALLGQYIFPLILTLSLTMALGVGLGWLMNRWTDLDPLTAYFCCVPGGASEVIGLSSDYGADNRMVAAFHTTRITLFVLTIPIFIGLTTPADIGSMGSAGPSMAEVSPVVMGVFGICVAVTVLLYYLYKVPAGTLFYGLIIGFIVGHWVVTTDNGLPSVIGGSGQALLGAMVGIRFDRPTFYKLKEIGRPSAVLLGFYFIFSLLLALLFHGATGLPYVTSLLSTVPAGAAEMSSTAIALNLEPTLVSSLHIIRVLVLFTCLPFFVRLLQKLIQKQSV